MRSEVAAGDLYIQIMSVVEVYALVPRELRNIPLAVLRDLPPDKDTLRSKLIWTGVRELDADLVLGFVERTRSMHGIDVGFTPENERTWDRLRRVNVNVAYALHEQLSIQGLVTAPYDGEHIVRIRYSLS